MAEQLILTLEFWREYRTYFHLGQDCGEHETTAQRAVERVETALLASQRFSFAGETLTHHRGSGAERRTGGRQ